MKRKKKLVEFCIFHIKSSLEEKNSFKKLSKNVFLPAASPSDHSNILEHEILEKEIALCIPPVWICKVLR